VNRDVAIAANHYFASFQIVPIAFEPIHRQRDK
jgi:hypothetical protein